MYCCNIVFGQWWIELWQSIIIEKFWFRKRKKNLANWPLENYVDATLLFWSRKPFWIEIIEILFFWVKVNLIGQINHSCEYLKQNNWRRTSHDKSTSHKGTTNLVSNLRLLCIWYNNLKSQNICKNLEVCMCVVTTILVSNFKVYTKSSSF